MRDGPAERGQLGLFRIDVDELEVTRRLGKGVDSLLAHFEPFRCADLLADELCDLCRRH